MSTTIIARELVNGHHVEVIDNDCRIMVRVNGQENQVSRHNDGFRIGLVTGNTVIEVARNYVLTLPERRLTIRRDFMDMTAEERDLLADALNQVWSSGLIEEHANFHERNFLAGIHWGPTFLPWHRYFLRRLELALQSIHPTLFLPYWDWTRDDSRDLDSEPWRSFFGNRMTRGKFVDWTFNRRESSEIPLPQGGSSEIFLPHLDDVVKELLATDYTDFRKIEGGTHVPGHRWVGGDMATGRSPIDPLFYLHHCNLDRLWAIWQANNPNVNQYDPTGIIESDERDLWDGSIDSRVKRDDVMKGIGGETPTPGGFLNCTLVGHGYARDRRLEQHWADQGNPTPLITEIF